MGPRSPTRIPHEPAVSKIVDFISGVRFAKICIEVLHYFEEIPEHGSDFSGELRSCVVRSPKGTSDVQRCGFSPSRWSLKRTPGLAFQNKTRPVSGPGLPALFQYA